MTQAKAPKRVRLERTFDAPLDDVWAMWTTKEGLASWMPPEGFTLEVPRLDLRVGGAWHYVMTAVGEEQVAMMRQAGAPLSRTHKATYTEIAPRTRLAFDHLVDFVPDRKPYHVAHLVQLSEGPHGVRMVLSLDPLHEERWTKQAAAGWEEGLDHLAELLKRR